MTLWDQFRVKKPEKAWSECWKKNGYAHFWPDAAFKPGQWHWPLLNTLNICQSPSSPRQWKTKLLQFNIEVDFCSLCKLRSVVKMQMLQVKGQNGISRERSKNRHLKTALLILKFKKKKLMGGVFRTLNINKWSMLWCISAVSWGSCATSSKQCSYKYSTEVHQRKPDIAVKPHS